MKSTTGGGLIWLMGLLALEGALGSLAFMGNPASSRSGGGRVNKPSPSAPPKWLSSSSSSSFQHQVQLNLVLEQKLTVEELLQVVETDGDMFNAVNCATALNRLSRIATRNTTSHLTSDSRFTKLMDQVKAKVGTAKPAQQNQLVSSLARLGVCPDVNLSKQLVERVALDARKYRPVELAGLVNGFARIEASQGYYWPRHLLDALARRTLEVMDDSPCDVLANIFCSLAKMGYRPTQGLVGALAARLTPNLPSLDSHWVAHTMACLARGEVHPGLEFLEAMRDETLRRLNHLGARDLGMIVSAFGRLAYRPGRFFFLSVVNHVSKKIDSFKDPQACSQIANGMSNLGVRAPEHFGASLVAVSWERIRDFKPPETANLLGALGKLKARPDEAYLQAFRDLVVGRMQDYAPSELANVVFGLSRMGYNPGPDFIAALTRRCLDCLEHGGGTREAASFLQSFVRLGERPSDETLRRLVSGFQAGLAQGGASENSLAIFTSSLAALEISPGGAFLRLATESSLGPAGRSSPSHPYRSPSPPSPTSAVHTAMFLSALSRLGYEPSRAQLERAMARLSPGLHTLNSRPFFTVLWALARWDMKCTTTPQGLAFLEAVALQAPPRLPDYPTAELVLLTLSLAHLGLKHPPVIDTLLTVVGARPEVYSDAEAASLVSSLSVMGAEMATLPPLLLAKAKREGKTVWVGGPASAPPLPSAQELGTPTNVYHQEEPLESPSAAK